MALILADRVREISSTSGTGDIPLSGAVVGYQSFTVIGDTNTTYYCLSAQTTDQWEVGVGTYSSGTNTLARTTVLSNSEGTQPTKINFLGGTKDIFVTYPEDKAVYLDGSGNVIPLGTISSAVWNGSTIGVAYGGTGASNATDARTNLGLGTISTQNANAVAITGGTITGITLAVADGGTGASNATDARTNLGLGTIATQNANSVAVTGGSISGITDLAVADGGTGASNATDARTNLGLGTIAIQNANSVAITGGTITGITDLAVADGGTGASNATDARTNLGLGTIATQNANAVAITGGSVNGTTVGATTASTGSFTNFVASGTATFTSNEAVKIPAGSTAQRPTPVAGMLRFNSTSGEFEGYSTAWASVGGSAITNDTATATDVYPLFADATSGTAANVYTSNSKLLYKPSTGELKSSVLNAGNGIVINNQTVATSYPIASGENGMSVGPITVASGQSVTVASGSRWVVI
jgi:hypothetical protein